MAKKRKYKHLKEKEKSKVKVTIVMLIRLILLALIVYSGYHIIVWVKENKQNNDIKDELANIVNVDSGKTKTDKLYASNYNIDFTSLKNTNSDIVRLA